MKLHLEPHPSYIGVRNLMLGDAVLGQVDIGGAVLRALGKDWQWRGIVDFLTTVKTRPADALAMAEAELAEARMCAGMALVSARAGDAGDAATVRARLASVDAAIAAARAWRELAGFEVEP